MCTLSLPIPLQQARCTFVITCVTREHVRPDMPDMKHTFSWMCFCLLLCSFRTMFTIQTRIQFPPTLKALQLPWHNANNTFLARKEIRYFKLLCYIIDRLENNWTIFVEYSQVVSMQLTRWPFTTPPPVRPLAISQKDFFQHFKNFSGHSGLLTL